MQPLISIVIPTRNRQSYCIAAINDILSYNYQKLELCIHDNSDDNSIGQYITQHISDHRLKYIHIPNQLNSVTNMNKAIAMTTGKYICMIGDDDTILPDFFKIVEWMDKNNIESTCPKSFVEYYWPGAYCNNPEGILFIPKFSNKLKQIDIKHQLKKLFRHGIVFYVKYNLPRLYHGIIRHDFVERVKQQTGHYFGGLTPDIYSTVALSSILHTHFVADIPFTIAGACKKSASSESTKHQHKGELNSAPQLYLRGKYNWDTIVPAYFSGTTLWAESALKAVQEMEIPELRELFCSNISYYRLAAFALIDDRVIHKLVWEKIWNSNHPALHHKILSFIGIFFLLCILITSKIIKRIKNYFKHTSTLKINGIKDISEAVNLTKQYTNNA